MNLCAYGCGQAALFLLKNKKWCCCKSWQSCPEIRNKNSNSQKGYKQTKEHIRKNIESNKDKNLSIDWKNKISTSMIEVWKKPECYNKLCGKNSSQWKGGISCEPYCPLWVDKEYKNSIKNRDGNKCLNPCCNGKSIRLCIHHIDYDKKECNPTNLITLCFSCNSKANKDRDWHTSWYKAIIYNRYN